VTFLDTQTLSTDQKQAVAALWNTVFPSGLAFSETRGIDDFLASLEDVHFTLVSQDGTLQACFIAFIRDELRFFSILLADSAQGKGLGTSLLDRAKQRYRELNGWVIDSPAYQRGDGMPYASPLAFYTKNGFEIVAADRWDNDQLKSVKVRWRK
jgi:GNAT superfamily N-acetyltransferase